MVSIVVVNWNAGPVLERCVRSLQRCAGDCEILLIDNASSDGSLEFVRGSETGLRVQRNRENLGFAGANNMGWRMSRYEHILFLNPDTECLAGSIQVLEGELTGKTWAAGGALIEPSGRPQIGFNVRAFPTVGSVATEMLLLDEIWPGNPWTRRYRMTGWDHKSAREVDQPAAACLMIRRSVLEQLGGFDEAFRPAWFEDVDLCRRIHRVGGSIRFQPDARFLHHGGSSLRRLPREQFLKYYHTNQIRYFAKHHGRETAAIVRRWIVIGMRLRAALSWIHPVVPGAGRAESVRIFRRVADCFASAPEIIE